MGMGSASTSVSTGIDNTNAGGVTVNRQSNTVVIAILLAALIAFALWTRKK